MNIPIGAPLLDACLLAVLSQGDAYGYSLTLQLKEHLGVSESTLYPVLRRLQKDGCLSLYDQPYQGRNRRYYTITDVGRQQLAAYRQSWLEHRQKIDNLLLAEEARERRTQDDQGPISDRLTLLPRRADC